MPKRSPVAVIAVSSCFNSVLKSSSSGLALSPFFALSSLQRSKKDNHHKFNNMWLNTSKGTSCLWRSKLTFFYFLTGFSFSSILVQQFLISDIAFLRYGTFIKDIITNWWKILRKKLLKFGNVYKVLVFLQFRGQFLHENSFCTKSFK